jgi:hypothetical protein
MDGLDWPARVPGLQAKQRKLSTLLSIPPCWKGCPLQHHAVVSWRATLVGVLHLDVHDDGEGPGRELSVVTNSKEVMQCMVHTTGVCFCQKQAYDTSVPPHKVPPWQTAELLTRAARKVRSRARLRPLSISEHAHGWARWGDRLTRFEGERHSRLWDVSMPLDGCTAISARTQTCW